jgi:hypothetical protein
MDNNPYSRGKIYRITDIAYTKFYFGSTVEELSQRMAHHRRTYNMYKRNGKGSNFSVFELFNEYGIENCKIELVEPYACNNLSELRQREGHHIQTNPCVNKYVAGRSKKQHYDDNRERLLEIRSEYTRNNQDKISEYNKSYRMLNEEKCKEQAKTYRLQNKEKVKEYNAIYRQAKKDELKLKRELHKAELKAYRDMYRINNKEKIQEYREKNKERHREHQNTQLQCEICGGSYTRSNKSVHYRTKKHIQASEK